MIGFSENVNDVEKNVSKRIMHQRIAQQCKQLADDGKYFIFI